jgi:phosphoglycolate phosphatase
LRENGIKRYFSDARFKLMIGNGLAILIKRALGSRKAPPGFGEKVRLSFKKFYANNLINLTVPYPGVSELIDKLLSDGFKLGVWTNKDQDLAQTLITDFFPGAFTQVIGASDQRPLKPMPQAGLELAQTLGADPNSLFYLGDSDIDMQAALSCGFIAVGVSWGYRSAKSLKKAGARVILNKPADLYPFMESFHG